MLFFLIFLIFCFNSKIINGSNIPDFDDMINFPNYGKSDDLIVKNNLRIENYNNANKNDLALNEDLSIIEKLKRLNYFYSNSIKQCKQNEEKLENDLVCFNRLNLLLKRSKNNLEKFHQLLKNNDYSLNIYPYTKAYYSLNNIFDSEDCLSFIDKLEILIDSLDHAFFLYETKNYYFEICSSVLILLVSSFLYYNKCYISIFFSKKFLIILIIFSAYLHEFKTLYEYEKANVLKTFNDIEKCKNENMVSSIFSSFLNFFFKPISFQKDCDFNEHLLYIDIIWKINIFKPIFTLIPKLLSTSFTIVLEQTGIAFNLFGKKVPFIHFYPLLILFCVFGYFLTKILFDSLVTITTTSKVIRKQKTIKLNHYKKLPLKSKRAYLNRSMSLDGLNFNQINKLKRLNYL